MNLPSRFRFQKHAPMTYQVHDRETGTYYGLISRTRDGWRIFPVAAPSSAVYVTGRETAAGLLSQEFRKES